MTDGWVRKNLEGSVHVLIEIIAWRDWEEQQNNSVKRACDSAYTETKHLPNTCLERYCYINLLGVTTVKNWITKNLHAITRVSILVSEDELQKLAKLVYVLQGMLEGRGVTSTNYTSKICYVCVTFLQWSIILFCLSRQSQRCIQGGPLGLYAHDHTVTYRRAVARNMFPFHLDALYSKVVTDNYKPCRYCHVCNYKQMFST
jgi:hypothetical protein